MDETHRFNQHGVADEPIDDALTLMGS